MASHSTAAISRRAVAAALALGGTAILLPVPARAASSVMIWPVDPVIEDGQRAVALWLENRGADEVSMQIRVFGWSQTGTEENYEDQERVIASPPLAVIPAGQRQLVRLMSTQAVPDNREVPYRVLVDELPSSDPSKDQADANGMGVKLQIRYSLPLFVHGKGLWTRQRAGAQRDPAGAARPQLQWRTEREGDTYYLRIRNIGTAHARLTNVEWVRDAAQPVDIHRGLLGYVLPGSEMRWPLKSPPPEGHVPQATVNAGETPVKLTAR